MSKRSEEEVLKFCGHMERICEERMITRVYREVEGTRKSGKPRRWWKDGLKCFESSEPEHARGNEACKG